MCMSAGLFVLSFETVFHKPQAGTHSVPVTSASDPPVSLSSEPWGYKHVLPHPVYPALGLNFGLCACSVSCLPTELGPSPEYAL